MQDAILDAINFACSSLYPITCIVKYGCLKMSTAEKATNCDMGEISTAVDSSYKYFLPQDNLSISIYDETYIFEQDGIPF